VIADLSMAACVGADPRIFDARTFPAADAGIEFCRRCPVPDLCLQTVRPSKSSFDGVAGGVVWRNGYRVRADNSTREDRLRREKETWDTRIQSSLETNPAHKLVEISISLTKETLGKISQCCETSANPAQCKNHVSTTHYTSKSMDFGVEQLEEKEIDSDANSTSFPNQSPEGRS